MALQWRYSWLTFLLAALVILLDQASKWLVAARLQLYEMWMPVPGLADYFSITYITNTGAAFGMFKQWNTIFIVIATIVIGVIVYYQHHLPAGQQPLRAILGLLLGGAAGNLIDRLRLGHVIDLFDFKFIFPWIFNVADSAIVVGVGLLILLTWRESQTVPPAALLPAEPLTDAQP